MSDRADRRAELAEAEARHETAIARARAAWPPGTLFVTRVRGCRTCPFSGFARDDAACLHPALPGGREFTDGEQIGDPDEPRNSRQDPNYWRPGNSTSRPDWCPLNTADAAVTTRANP